MQKILNWFTSLKIAIFLLLLIALSSSIGTVIPQEEIQANYLNHYENSPLLGFINGKTILFLQLDHIYSSYWFLILLIWLSLSLTVCSFKRQWPKLKETLTWIDYKQPRQIEKLAISQVIEIKNNTIAIERLAEALKNKRWKVKESTGRFSARKGSIGRAGPILIHIGIILLMLGSTIGVLNGQKIERFVSEGNSIEIVNKERSGLLKIQLNEFNIERDPQGRTEQFQSSLNLIRSGKSTIEKDISVNHPLRYQGLTIYQADWSLSSVIIQIGTSPKIQLPLKRLDELGEQVWGVSIPTSPDGLNPILITLSSEKGPVSIFNKNGDSLFNLTPGGISKELYGKEFRINKVLLSSGLLVKYDPGVPIVYLSFGVILIGGILSLISSRQLWAVKSKDQDYLYIGGLSNRDLPGLENELSFILKNAFN